MRASDALRAVIPRLREAGVEDASRDARLLLAHAMGVPAGRLTLHLPDDVGPDMLDRLDHLIAARIRRQPVSQLTGKRLFWGRSFAVTRDVLDPRPETETLIIAALSWPFQRVLDLGLGSGCILLTLLAERPDSTGIGVEVSPPALDVARMNRATLGLQGRADLRAGRWFAPVDGRFDLIVSNPPYIAAAEMAGLSPEVRDWEPAMALTPGGDGLDAHRAIAAGVLAHLTPGGRVLLEIGPAQGAAVVALLGQAGLVRTAVLPDLDGRDRVVVAYAP